ncbi:MAG: 50S ribosomal protein L25 [Sedimentisphaerales bacterium]|nr:50S ribosomal protein L25 [Sedimentisphaerales bacterium]
MEKSFLLKAEKREQTGSSSAAKMRKSGRIPAVVYGHKEEPAAISLDAHTLIEGLHHGHRVMDVQIGKKQEKVIVKDMQYDHLGRDIIHVDLMRVDVSEKIEVSVPIEIKGVAKGTHEGGVIEVHTDHLEVECLVTEIPKSIVVNVKDIGVGEAVHASDVELPAGVKLVSDPEILLLACNVVAEVKTTEELEAEMPAVPEVITEVKEEAEEGKAEEKSPEKKE